MNGDMNLQDVQGEFRPSLFDFMKRSHPATLTDNDDPFRQHEVISPLAQRPQPQPRPAIPVRPANAQSSSPATVVRNQVMGNRTGAFFPTPPGSPFQFTPNKTVDAFTATPQSLVSYTPLSGTLLNDSLCPQLAAPGPRTDSAPGSFLDASLLQAISFEQTFNPFVLPSGNEVDPFTDRSDTELPGALQGAIQTNTLNFRPPFKPSRALLDMPRTIDPELASFAQQVGIELDGNYKGDITKEHIFNAMAPTSDNCALHIIGLPADITLPEVFSEIVGKVFSFQLHAPIPGKWTGCGARLVFTNRAAAEQFYWASRTGLGIIVRGHQIRVLWNRDPCRPQLYADRHQSRVLQIKGLNTPNFSAAAVEQFFAKNLLFKLVDRKEWLDDNGWKVVELHFPSILGQSRPAMKQFYEMLDETDQRSIFKIQYAPDPCEPVAQNINQWEGLQL